MDNTSLTFQQLVAISLDRRTKATPVVTEVIVPPVVEPVKYAPIETTKDGHVITEDAPITTA